MCVCVCVCVGLYVGVYLCVCSLFKKYQYWWCIRNTEIRNEWNFFFLVNTPPVIEHTYSTVFPNGRSTSETLLFIFYEFVTLYFLYALNVIKSLILEIDFQFWKKRWTERDMMSMDSAILAQSCVSYNFLLRISMDSTENEIILP